MRRVRFLIFNQMLSVLSRVYVVVVVVVVVICLINGLYYYCCCCCCCYSSYQGSMLLLLLLSVLSRVNVVIGCWLLVLLLVYVYILMCLFSTLINKIRVTIMILHQHFICLPSYTWSHHNIYIYIYFNDPCVRW